MALDVSIPRGDKSREIIDTLSRLGYVGGCLEYGTTLPLRPKDAAVRGASASSSSAAAAAGGAGGGSSATPAIDLVGAASVTLARGHSGSMLRKRDARRLASVAGSKRPREGEQEGEVGGVGAPSTAPPPPFREFHRITLAMDPVDAPPTQGSAASSSSSSRGFTRSNLAGDLKDGAGVLATYDLVAAQPVDNGGLAACLSAGRGAAIDLIVLDMSSGKLPFPLHAKDVAAVLGAGMAFELKYAPAIRDSSLRRAFFTHCATLLRLTRGAGLVLSSGARTALEVRTPRAVAAIASLAGFSHQQAMVALTATPAAALAHGEKRRRVY